MKIEESEEWKNRSRTKPVDIIIGFINSTQHDLINCDIFTEPVEFRRNWQVDDLSKVYDAQEWCLSMIEKDMNFFKENKKTELPEMIVRCVIAEPRMALGTDGNLFTWHRGWVQATITKNSYEKLLAKREVEP
jgi:hypothetical protein